MSSLAQEESRSMSENITWGKRKSAADGKVTIPYKSFLGYEKGPNDTIVINPKQAEIIKRIYREYMQGKTPWMIARMLTEEGVPTPTGRGGKWAISTIDSILSNEKYKGSALLQKKFTVDFLSKKIKVNEGEVPQYYIEENHEPIIPPEEWERVQKETVRRRNFGRRYSGNNIFATRIVCGDCGAFFGSKVWNSTSEKYRRVIWQCNDKFKGDTKCEIPHITEDEIKDKFIHAFNILYDMKKEIIENCNMIAKALTDCSEIDKEKDRLTVELETLSEIVNEYIHKNATQAQDQEEYIKKYNGYVERYDELSKRINELDEERIIKQGRAESFSDFIRTFKKQKSNLIEFDESVWLTTVEKVKICPDKTFEFTFNNGTEISIK